MTNRAMFCTQRMGCDGSDVKSGKFGKLYGIYD